MKIKTESGNVTLDVPDAKMVEGVREYLPLAGPLARKPNGADYAIVMKQGSEEVWGVRQRSAEFDPGLAQEAFENNVALIVLALKRYLRIGFSGVLLPATFTRPARKGKVEVGVAYFGAAAPADDQAGKMLPLADIDAAHGAGFSEMVASFMGSMFAASGKSGIPLCPVIGLDHRPQSAFGTLGLMFMIHGRDVYSLSGNSSPTHPVWNLLRSTGIRKAWRLPCVPVTIRARKRGWNGRHATRS